MKKKVEKKRRGDGGGGWEETQTKYVYIKKNKSDKNRKGIKLALPENAEGENYRGQCLDSWAGNTAFVLL